MPLENVNRFWEWVRQEAYDRGWSIRELERRAGLNRGRLSNAASLAREPGMEVFEGLARAFDLSLLEIQRKAGYLPSPPPDRIAEFNEIAAVLAEVPDGPIRAEAMAAIRAIAESARYRATEQQEHAQ